MKQRKGFALIEMIIGLCVLAIAVIFITGCGGGGGGNASLLSLSESKDYRDAGNQLTLISCKIKNVSTSSLDVVIAPNTLGNTFSVVFMAEKTPGKPEGDSPSVRYNFPKDQFISHEVMIEVMPNVPYAKPSTMYHIDLGGGAAYHLEPGQIVGIVIDPGPA